MKATLTIEGTFANLKALRDQHGDKLPEALRGLLGGVTGWTSETTSRNMVTLEGLDSPLQLDVDVRVTG